MNRDKVVIKNNMKGKEKKIKTELDAYQEWCTLE